MIGRRPRQLSQRNYLLVQEIREGAAHFRQIDAGLGYRRAAVERKRVREIEARPLHIGPQIDAVRAGEGWDAA